MIEKFEAGLFSIASLFSYFILWHHITCFVHACWGCIIFADFVSGIAHSLTSKIYGHIAETLCTYTYCEGFVLFIYLAHAANYFCFYNIFGVHEKKFDCDINYSNGLS